MTAFSSSLNQHLAPWLSSASACAYNCGYSTGVEKSICPVTLTQTNRRLPVSSVNGSELLVVPMKLAYLRLFSMLSYNRFVEVESCLSVQMMLFLQLFYFGEYTSFTYIVIFLYFIFLFFII